MKSGAKVADLSYQGFMRALDGPGNMKATSAYGIILLACLTVAVAGCGRRGDLDPPSVAAAEARGEKPAPVEVPERSFVLDALIE